MSNLTNQLEERILGCAPRTNYEEKDPYYQLKTKNIARQREFGDLDLQINVKCKIAMLKETTYAGEKTRELKVEYDVNDLQAKIEREVRKHFLTILRDNNIDENVMSDCTQYIMIKFPLNFSDI